MLNPKFLTNLVVAIAVIYSAAMVALIFYPPYTGFDLEPGEDGRLVVSRLDEEVAARGLQLGDVLATIRSAGGVTVELNESSYPATTLRARQLHEAKGDHIRSANLMYQVLSDAPVLVQTLDGKQVELPLDRLRPVTSVNWEVWYCILLSVVCWLIPALVWAWRPRDRDITYVVLAGAGLGAATISAATFYQIEMYFMPPPFFWLIFELVGFGNFAFVTFAAAAFFYFPQKLPRADAAARLLFGAVLLYTGWAFFDGWEAGVPLSGQLLYFEYAEVYLVEVGVYLLVLVNVAIQGFYNRWNPVGRAEVLWIAFAAVMTPVGFFALYLVPVLLGYEALASRTWTTTLLVSGFLLLAAGVSRLKFLSLERHVGAVYQWTGVAIGFVALDAVLVYLLNISLTTSTVIMAVLLLFVYLPLRQWLWGRLTRLRMKDYEVVFGEAADALVEGALQVRSPDNVWLDILDGVFRPITLERIQGEIETGLAHRGQSLRVAANEFATGVELQYADQGSRIFTEDDVDLLNSLQRLFVRMFDYRDGVARGQLLERERIRRDLHDQVGSKLLSLVYRSSDPESQRLASETIALLGEIMTAIKQEPVGVAQLAGELRSICVESSRAAGLQCVVEDQMEGGVREIPSFYYLNILSMLRELINNTAKHSGAQNVMLRVVVDDRSMHLEYRDDGSGFDLETVSRGNGLYNIQSRAEEMRAELQWQTLAQTRFNLSIPLENMAWSAS